MSAAGSTSRRTVLLGAGRAVLAAAVAGSVGACTSDEQEPAPPPAPDPDDALREATAERERSLLAAYDAVLLAAPELTARLAPLRAHHEVHLAEVTEPVASPAPTASGAASPAASASPSAPPVLPPGDPLAVLAQAERAAGAAHATDALAARDRTLAALLASLSASEQSHPVALA